VLALQQREQELHLQRAELVRAEQLQLLQLQVQQQHQLLLNQQQQQQLATQQHHQQQLYHATPRRPRTRRAVGQLLGAFPGMVVAACPALGLLVTSDSDKNTLSVWGVPGGASGGGGGGGRSEGQVA